MTTTVFNCNYSRFACFARVCHSKQIAASRLCAGLKNDNFCAHRDTVKQIRHIFIQHANAA